MTGDNGVTGDILAQIRAALVTHPDLPRTQLADLLGISRKTLYKHLGRLTAAEGGSEGVAKRPPTPPPPPEPKQNRRKPPPGPHSTAFKKGNPGGPGIPPEKGRGNKNALKTGEQESIYLDTLNDTERALHSGINTDELKRIDDQIRLETIRQRRMMMRIAELQLHSMTVVEISEEFTPGEPDKDGKPTGQSQPVTKSKKLGTLGQIQAIEDALTRVNNGLSRLIAEKHKIKAGAGPGAVNVQTYLDALTKAGDVWDDEPDPDDEGDGEAE